MEKCDKFCEENVDLFVGKVKAKIFKIPVANKSLEPVREGTTMGQIPENVSSIYLYFIVIKKYIDINRSIIKSN